MCENRLSSDYLQELIFMLILYVCFFFFFYCTVYTIGGERFPFNILELRLKRKKFIDLIKSS